MLCWDQDLKPDCEESATTVRTRPPGHDTSYHQVGLSIKRSDGQDENPVGQH